MTAQELKDYILAQLAVPVNQVVKVINSLFAMIDFTTTQVSSIIPDWTNSLTFNTDGSGDGIYCKHPDTNGKKRIFETKTDGNINNAPPTNPIVTENTHWKEVSASSSAAIPEWSAGLYGPGLIIVYHNHSVDGRGLYILLDPVRPYNSANIETEITAGDWEPIASGGSGGGVVIAGSYADITALLADQANQEEGQWYMVDDASADATVDSGWAIYEKLAATTGAIGDYIKRAEQESLDVTFPNASEIVAGKVEEATDAEVSAGTATGATGAKLFIPPTKLATFITSFLAAAHTWALQQIFTTAPRFSSTTASQFLKVDSNKDLMSVAAASQSDAITGTDDTKPITSLSLEQKRSIKLVSFSNNATGSSTIDCEGKQEVTVVYTTTVTGGITIALTGDSNLEVLNIIIPITGSNIAITTPSTTRMSRYNEVSSGDGWHQSTKILQVSSTGTADTHELSFKKASTSPTFLLRYDGPARA